MTVSVGILSIGDMGMGIARLLQVHSYRVLTVGAGRSQDTLDRIREASIEALPTDQDLVIQSDYIVCVVITAAGLARHGTTYGQDHDDIHGFPRFINNLPKAD